MKSFWNSKIIRILYDHTGLSNPVEAILTLARELVAKSGQNQPPYDPTIYATIQGVRKVITTKLYCDARLLLFPDGHIIELSSASLPGRRNFSCCHEVAHAFFFTKELEFSTINCSLDFEHEIRDEEYLCNKAAGELLMPYNVFRHISLDYIPSFNSIKDLADKFKSSLEATILRLRETTAWDKWNYIAILWKPNNQQKPENSFYVDKIWSNRGTSSLPQIFNKLNSPGVYHTYKTGEQICDKLKNEWYAEFTKIGSGNKQYVFSLNYKKK